MASLKHSPTAAAIEVTPIPDDLDEETIQDLFENEDQTGGGEIEELVLKDGRATITFKDEAVARRVVKKRSIEIDNTKMLIYKARQELLENRNVIVEGLPDSVKEIKMKLFFESKKRGGGPIEQIEMRPDKKCGIITYKHVNDAKTIVSKEYFDMAGSTVQVSFYVPGPEETLPQRSVYISGLTEDMDKEFIEDIIEQMEVEGVTQPESIDLKLDENTAVVVFDDIEAAESLITRGRHSYEGVELSMSSYDGLMKSSNNTNNLKSIQVKNLPKAMSKDKLLNYFESKKRQGGPVEKVELFDSGNLAIVHFENHSDAARQVAQKTITMKENTVTIEWHQNTMADSEETSNNTIIVEGISELDKDDLEDLFENEKRGGGAIKKLHIHDGKAIIQFEQSSVAERVIAKECIETDGSKLIIKPYTTALVEGSTKIVLTGLNQASSQKLQNFLENPNRIDGGPVKHVESGDKKGTYIVEFVNPKDAAKIIQLGEFKFKTKLVTVSWYNEHETEPKWDDSSREIMVEGLDESINEEVLEDLFENRNKTGGGSVESVTISEDRKSAVIVFEEERVSENVLHKGKVSYDGKVLTCSPTKQNVKTDIQSSSIEVTNIPNTHSEMLTLFFENNRKTGGGDIENVSYSSADGRAVINFKDAKDATGVLKKHNAERLVFGDRQLRIQKFNAERLGKYAFSVNSCAIEIKDLPQNSNTDTIRENLMLLFENKNMTGGTEIENIHVVDDLTRAVITYMEPEVAENVVRKHMSQGITLDDQLLVIKALPCSQCVQVLDGDMEDNLLLLANLPEDVTRSEIQISIRPRAKATLKDVIFGLKIGKALLIFDNLPDFDEIFQHLRLKPLKGNMIRAERVEKSKSIEVYGIDKPKPFSKQKVRLYFEHKASSKGGDVEKVFIDDTYQCAVVTFEDPKDVENVLAKRDHQIEKQHLTVKKHYQCIGALPIWHDSSMPVSTIPQEVILAKPRHEIMVFIIQSAQVKRYIDDKLKNCHASLRWSEINEKSDQILIRCTLTKSVQGYQSLSKSWEKAVEKTITTLFEEILVEEIQIPPAVKEATVKYVEDSHASNTENILLLPDSHYGIVRVVGRGNSVSVAKEELLKMVDDTEKAIYRKSQMTTVTSKDMDQWKLKFLLLMEFKENMESEFEDMKVDINIPTKMVSFYATPDDIKSAQLEMFKLLQTMKSKVEGLLPDIMDVYRNPAIEKYINQALHRKGLQYTFYEVGHETVVVYGNDENMIGTAMAVVLKCVSDQNFALFNDSIAMLKSEAWKKFHSDLLRQYGEVLQIIESSRAVRMICPDNILDAVYNKLEEFFKTNTIKERFIHAQKGVVKLLNTSNDLQRFSDKFAAHSVKVQAILDDNTSTIGISIKGTEEGITKAKPEIDSLVKSVKSERYSVTKPGMSSYFCDETGGKSHLTSLENKYKVAIEIANDHDDDNFGFEILGSVRTPVKALEIAKVNLNSGMVVIVMRDDVCKHRGDCLLVPATKEFDHEKGIGRELMVKAGSSIKQECSTYISKRGSLFVTDVVATKAGNLPYHHMMHAVFPDYIKGKSIPRNIETELHETFYKCFKAANKLELRNIVIPGSILHGFPLDSSTNILANAIRDYSDKVSAMSTLAEIKLLGENDNVVSSLQDVASLLDPAAKDPTFGSGSAFVPPHKKAPSPAARTDLLITPEGVKLKIIKGLIAKEQVDVIVNTTSNDLDLRNGAVSKSLLQEGGDILQKECSKIAASGFHSGMVADTTGGKLKCKRVYHGSCENWNNGDPNSITILVEFLLGCLDKGHGSGMTSLGFPAIGTGNLGFPRDFVAKTMLEAVQNFSKANPKTKLKDIRFILYDKDKPTIKAFEYAIGKANASNTPVASASEIPSTQKMDVRPKTSKRYQSTRSGKSMNGSKAKANKDSVKPDLKDGEIKIGSITITVRQGDLTKEKTDAIVNSTSKDMKFISQVSKAILKAGGDQIQKECQAKGVMKDHIAITGAGKLGCKHVIHIDAPAHDTTSWKVRILQCLKLAENNSLKSISFPALGTGALKIAPAIMAETIMDATADFSSKETPKHMNNIRIVIFEKSMMNEFAQELNRIADSAAGKKKGFIRKATDWLGITSPDIAEEKCSPFIPVDKETEMETDGELDLVHLSKPTVVATCTLLFYGFESSNIQKAIDEVMKICNDECKGMKIEKGKDSECIAKLTESQIKRIKGIESKHLVTITINRGSHNSISIEGRPSNTAPAYFTIKDILSEVEKAEIQEREEKILQEKVRWQVYDDEKDDYDDYPPNMNYLIEQAYKAQKPFVTWKEKDGDFRIEFNLLQEYPVGNKEEGMDVRRYAPGDIEIPGDWDTMDGKTDCFVKDLTPSDLEYEIVIQKFTESMDNFNKVISIQRIQNPRVYRTYASNKTHVQMMNPKIKHVERQLWHGTSADAVPEINATGFNRSFCGKNATVWGKGVYFAADASYSHGYAEAASDDTRSMYLCKVITGEFCLGNKDFKVPPVKDPVTNRKYDCVVNDVKNPKIFVVFFDSLAYPEFLITFN